jgi:hypothetical protein
MTEARGLYGVSLKPFTAPIFQDAELASRARVLLVLVLLSSTGPPIVVGGGKHPVHAKAAHRLDPVGKVSKDLELVGVHDTPIFTPTVL